MVEMITGFVSAAFVSAVSIVVGMQWISILFVIISLLAIVELFDRVPFWAISYTIGYLVSVIWFGKYFLELWEIIVYIIIFVFFIGLKIYRNW